jgi:hypothetical protein
MKNECSVVRDILPLYLENMVSEETSAFIKEHLESCSACANLLESMKSDSKIEKVSQEKQIDLDAEVAKAMKAIRKKFRIMTYRVAAIIIAVLIAFGTLLHFFPVYRILNIGYKYYSYDQIAMALCIGSSSDRKEAQAVLRLADQAFNDTKHTRAENETKYGLLARYTTDINHYTDAAFNTHSLELWSAHLGKEEGWIWVYYSSETFNHDGSKACGSMRIPSLWKVEKNDSGEWIVVQILEKV